MAMKPVSNNSAATVDQTKSMETAYRTLMASSRQKTFEKVLNQVRDGRDDQARSEINALQGEMRQLESLQARETSAKGEGSLSRDGLQSTARRTDSTNNLATSALLRLSALSPGRGSPGKYCLNAIEAASKGGTEKAPGKHPGKSRIPGQPDLSGDIGSLSSRFESGPTGVDVIGYDKNGGTSYGIYQISSRTGTMKSFIQFLEERSPEWAQRLLTAGPANTGGVRGSMPSEWKRIAAEDPERFAQLQHDFIAETHFAPALREIQERTGVDVTQHSRALTEVLWSTAVQHGPNGAARIFCNVIDRGRDDKTAFRASDLIGDVYASRARQFGSSTSAVRSAVQGRFREEKALALAMLAQDRTSRTMDA